MAYLCDRLHIIPIVGFLLAGVLVGPGGLGVVNDRALIEQGAEVGVILLLFSIGIEFSLEKLTEIWRLILLGGGLQVVTTVGQSDACRIGTTAKVRADGSCYSSRRAHSCKS